MKTRGLAVFRCFLNQTFIIQQPLILQIEDIKQRLSQLEKELTESLFVRYQDITVNQRGCKVYLCQKLMKQARKSKVWKSNEFCITLRNAKYGLDSTSAKSPGGRDGIYLLNRDFEPYNEMQHRIFDQFIDKPTSDYKAIIKELRLSSEHIKAVRVVSHHMRIVGLYHIGNTDDTLVLVDVDTKR